MQIETPLCLIQSSLNFFLKAYIKKRKDIAYLQAEIGLNL